MKCILFCFISLLLLAPSFSESTTNQEIDPEILCLPYLTNSELLLTKEGFTLYWNTETKQALWAAYVLTKEEVYATTATRTDVFKPDRTVPGSLSADNADYTRSSFDRGHLVPAADMKFSEHAMSDSFLFSNISPQHPSLNRTIWAYLESCVRFWAAENKIILVVTGPVFRGPPSRYIGANKIPVPDFFFKALLIYEDTQQRCIGFILPNEKVNATLDQFACTIDSLEAQTGIDFFHLLPDDQEQKLESEFDLQYWPLNRFDAR